MDNDLLFVGYRSFKSKSEKMCYILSFLTPPTVSQDGTSCFTTNVDIFTDENKFNAFIKSHEILNYVKIQYDIIGDKVRYHI